MDLSPSQVRRMAELPARPPAPEEPDVDGMRPSLVLEPDEVAAAGRALAFCRQESLAVVPRGAATRLHLGNLPARLDVCLSTRRWDRVEDYVPGDLTVTVGAGAPLHRVQEVLRAEGQFLPWDPPRADRATVGGVLATGEPGFRKRPGARPRDLLLGCEAVLADGTIVKTGGKVVKNVAGYELTKLLVGSLGTLAVIARAHLRVRPLPERVASLLAFASGLSPIADAVLGLRRRGRDPEMTAILDPSLSAAFGFSGWTLALRLEGIEEDVGEAIAAMKEGLRPLETVELGGEASASLWTGLRDWPAPGEAPSLGIVIRGQATPSSTLRLAERWHGAGVLVAYPDAGLVVLRTADPEAYERLLGIARTLDGNAVLEHGPRELKLRLDVFGERPGGWEIMRRMKEKLDPENVLSPGRFVGRL